MVLSSFSLNYKLIKTIKSKKFITQPKISKAEMKLEKQLLLYPLS